MSLDLNKNEYTKEKDNYSQNDLGNAKEDCRDNPMKVMLDTGAAIHVCTFWFGEHLPLTVSTQKLTSASGADINVFGRRTLLLMCNESPERCHMAACLVCDVTTPMLCFSQPLQKVHECSVDKDNTHIFLDEHFQIPIVQQGQHLFIEPTSFCGVDPEQPCVVLPVSTCRLNL